MLNKLWLWHEDTLKISLFWFEYKHDSIYPWKNPAHPSAVTYFLKQTTIRLLTLDLVFPCSYLCFLITCYTRFFSTRIALSFISKFSFPWPSVRTVLKSVSARTCTFCPAHCNGMGILWTHSLSAQLLFKKSKYAAALYPKCMPSKLCGISNFSGFREVNCCIGC